MLLGVLSGLLLGCTTADPVRPAALWGRGRPLQQPAGPDVVLLHVALVECLVGDRYINEGLWPLADETAIPSEHRYVLEQNGFRVGQLGGVPPPELLGLLTSKRSCINPQAVRFHVGDTKTVLLGPVLERCRFQLNLDGQREPVAFEQAQVLLGILPSLAPEGKLRLEFTPQIESGERRLVLAPDDDHAHLMPRPQRDLNRYPALGWDVTLAPNEYVVVGARYDRPGSLGYQAFVRTDETPPVQLLLAIRACRTAPDEPDDDAGTVRAPSVASEASSSVVPAPR
jgi:hypothetical protein